MSRRRSAAALRAALLAVLVVGAPVAATSLAFSGTAAAATTPTLTMSGGDARYAMGTGPTAVDPTLDVTNGATTIEGARVVVDNPKPGDTLGFDAATATDHGVSGGFDSTTNVLTLSGSASANDYEAVLRTVTFSNSQSSPDRTTRDVTFSLGTKLPYADNGHYYEFVTNGTIDWDVARTEAANRDYFGLQGYLVTVTSADENAFVADKLEGEGWIGASDRANEGVWEWTTGPETGDTFPGDGSVPYVPDQPYENWASEEPNDLNGEDRAHYHSDGTWNDYANGNDDIQGYVVEYGGTTGDPTVEWRGTKRVAVVDETPPTAAAGSDRTVDEDAAVGFDASGSSDGETSVAGYEWDWESDGNYDDTGETTSHAFADPGTYTVTLRVTDDGGNTDTDALTVSVSDVTPPTAAAGSDRTVDEDAAVGFDASGSTDNANIAAYEWDWESDGTYDDTGSSATHTYATPGTYTATLRVTDGGGNADTDALTVSVSDLTAPTAAAGGDVTTDEDAAVGFDASGSTDNGNIASYGWDWESDGNYDDTGATATHTYADPGTYTATLRVTDGGGNADTDARTVSVSDVTPPTAEVGPNRTVDRGTALAFDAAGSTDNGNVAGYEWDWESDGNYDDTGATATHAYATPGTYTATLRVTDGGGNVDTDALTVSVERVTSGRRLSGTVVTGDGGTDARDGRVDGGNGSYTVENADIDESARLSIDGVDTDAVTVESVELDFDMGTSADNAVFVRAEDGPPAGVAAYRGGPVRAYVTVDVDGNLAERVSRGTVRFRVAADAMPDDPTDVVVSRFRDGEWLPVPTTYGGDRRFEVAAPGTATFAVVTGGSGSNEASGSPDAATSTPDRTATATPDRTATEAAAPDGTPTPDVDASTSAETTTEGSVPGFGPVAALVAFLVVGSFARRRASRR